MSRASLWYKDLPDCVLSWSITFWVLSGAAILTLFTLEKRDARVISAPPPNLKYVTSLLALVKIRGTVTLLFGNRLSWDCPGIFLGLGTFLWRNLCLWFLAAFARPKVRPTSTRSRDQTITCISRPFLEISIISSWFCIVQFSGCYWE